MCAQQYVNIARGRESVDENVSLFPTFPEIDIPLFAVLGYMEGEQFGLSFPCFSGGL